MAKAMQPQKLYFSQAMQTEKYKNRAKRCA